MKVFIHNLKSILFIFAALSVGNILSQNVINTSCGTFTSQETLKYYNSLKPELKNYQKQFSTFSKGTTSKGSSSKGTAVNYIPIKAHVIRTSNGNNGLTEKELEEAINDLNVAFAGSYLEFFLCNGINFIDSNNFYQFKTTKEKLLIQNYYTSGVLNIYFTDLIENSSDESICGYTYSNELFDIILMQNDCATNGTSLAHEVGHFLSLIHTHGANNSKLTDELVNGSNCSSTGDQICDTPADPMLSSQNVNNFCNYFGTETDVNGDFFAPDTKNIMSYSYKACRSHFSQEQLARMYAYYMTAKSYLTCDESKDEISAIQEDILEDSDVKVYPNPISGDVIHIKMSSEKLHYFQISNLMGQVFLSGVINNQPIHVDHLSSGSYLLTITNNDTKIIKRIIK